MMTKMQGQNLITGIASPSYSSARERLQASKQRMAANTTRPIKFLQKYSKSRRAKNHGAIDTTWNEAQCQHFKEAQVKYVSCLSRSNYDWLNTLVNLFMEEKENEGLPEEREKTGMDKSCRLSAAATTIPTPPSIIAEFKNHAFARSQVTRNRSDE